MTDVITDLIEDCRTYWREVDIPHNTAADMASELEAHLREAAANGRDPLAVVGGDVSAFAREWAAEHRSEHARPLPSWDRVQNRARRREPTQLFKWAVGIVALALVLTAAVTSGEESTVDNEVWRWVWTVFALVMSIGEIFSAGFFLLPFGIGAGLAAAAAWMDMAGAVQWIAFFGGTAASFVYVRRFMRMQDTDDGLQIGPSRYVGMSATVLEDVDAAANTGRIRVEADEWRAITDGDTIPAGTIVEIVELRGTRLVVTPAD